MGVFIKKEEKKENLENNIINLMNNLRNKTYRLGKYYTFKVYEPKERYIQALPYNCLLYTSRCV